MISISIVSSQTQLTLRGHGCQATVLHCVPVYSTGFTDTHCTEGWPGWVDLHGWLNTNMVWTWIKLADVTHSSTKWAWPILPGSERRFQPSRLSALTLTYHLVACLIGTGNIVLVNQTTDGLIRFVITLATCPRRYGDQPFSVAMAQKWRNGPHRLREDDDDDDDLE